MGNMFSVKDYSQRVYGETRLLYFSVHLKGPAGVHIIAVYSIDSVHKARFQGAMPPTRAVSTNRFGSASSQQTDGLIEGPTATVDPESAAVLGIKSAAPVPVFEKIFSHL